MLIKLPVDHQFGLTYAGIVFEAENQNGRLVVTGVTEESEELFMMFNPRVVLERAQQYVDTLMVDEYSNVLEFKPTPKHQLRLFVKSWERTVAARKKGA